MRTLAHIATGLVRIDVARFSIVDDAEEGFITSLGFLSSADGLRTMLLCVG
jgi:hypothetical protein